MNEPAELTTFLTKGKEFTKEQIKEFYRIINQFYELQVPTQQANVQRVQQFDAQDFLKSCEEICKNNKDALQKIDLTKGAVLLPKALLSPNDLHSRFSHQVGDNDQIWILKTEAFSQILACFEQIMKEESKTSLNYLIYGGIGIGKSFGLALCVSMLRQKGNQENNLFIYINNKNEVDYLYILKEIIYSLYFVKIEGNFGQAIFNSLESLVNLKNRTLQDLWIKLKEVKTLDEQKKCIETLISEISSFYSVYLVVDQAVIGDYLIDDIIKNLLKSRMKKLRMIFCSSRKILPDSNDYFSDLKPQIIDAKLTEEEVKEFLERNFLPHIKEYNCKQEKQKQLTNEDIENICGFVSKLANFIPYEITIFTKAASRIAKAQEESESMNLEDPTPKFNPFQEDSEYQREKEIKRALEEFKNLKMTAGSDDERLKPFINTLQYVYTLLRLEELNIIHNQFKKKVKNPSGWVRCLALKRLNCPIKIRKDLVIDENICGLQKFKDFQELYTLEFYNLLYQDFIFHQYNSDVQSEIDKFLEDPDYIQTLSTQRSEAARGIAMEYYILDKLVYNAMMPNDFAHIHWKFTPYTKGGKLEEITIKIENYTKNNVDRKNICTLFRDYLKSELEGKTYTKTPTSSDTKKKIHDFSGKLFVPSTRYMKYLDALFVDTKNLTVFLIQITSNLSTHSKSDVLFYELADPASQPNAATMEKEKNELRALAKYLRERTPIINVQWIWIGLIDGKVENHNIKALNFEHFHPESWFHLANEETSEFKKIRKLF